MPADPRCFTISELAERWKCSVGKVRDLILSGRLPAFDVGTLKRHSWRISMATVEEIEKQPADRPQPKPRRQRLKPGRFFGPNGRIGRG